MNIYIDINNTALKKDLTLANYFKDFIQEALKNHKLFWLTTHYRNEEDLPHLMQYLNDSFDKEVADIVKNVKPMKWNMLKTEGIDFAQDFLFYDDSPMFSEIEVLKKNNKQDCWIKVDLISNPDFWKEELSKIRMK